MKFKHIIFLTTPPLIVAGLLPQVFLLGDIGLLKKLTSQFSTPQMRIHLDFFWKQKRAKKKLPKGKQYRGEKHFSYLQNIITQQ
ncbi:MAG: hypothetical protein HQK83_08465 [Fibrobacteria bacterium]|nr:hypothetical protein [Fibrobacteria bacterium]